MTSLKYIFPLFILSFIIFNLNINSLGSGDTIPARLLPLNILSGDGLYFDKYTDYLQNRYHTIYYFTQFNGHYISSYPILTGLIAVPLYLPFYIYFNLIGVVDVNSLYNISTALQKICASLLAGLSVGLFFILINKISNNIKTGIIFSLIFAFCTQTFSVSSQALWQHGTANLFMIISQIFLIRKFYLWSLVFAVFSFWSRPNFFLYLIIIYFFIVIRNKSGRIIYSIFFLLGTIILVGYNLYFFNSLFGGYSNQTGTFSLNNPISNIFGLLFSPTRGVIFYTPLFIFSLLSILFWREINKTHENLKIIFVLNYIYFISGLILNSFWGCWWGGHSWGDRLLTDIAVSAIILCYYFYINIRSRLLKLILYLFVIYSVFIQSVGVCCYSNSKWDSIPNNVDLNIGRLWDFTDNPILRSIKAGPDLRGLNIIQGNGFKNGIE